MILFDLKCSSGHVFEAWFRDSSSFEEQSEACVIHCPLCDSDVVSKAPMAPRIAGTGQSDHASLVNESRNSELGEDASFASEKTEAAATESRSPPGLAKAPDAFSGEYAHFSEEMISKLSEIRDAVEKSCDYVGDQFPEEARKIHYGESEERGIYGEASDEEAEDLAEEGVAFTRLPIKPRKVNS